MTGRTLLRSRPGIMALLERVARGDIAAIFVEGLERIGRRAGDVTTVCARLEGMGLRLYSPGGLFDWKLVPFLAAIAEFQSREIGLKTYRGGVGTTSRGRVAAGLGYGYRVVHRSKTECNREIAEDAAAIVQRIFRDYAAGQSPYKIAAALNAEGIPSPSGRTWCDSTIRGDAKKDSGILRNVSYVGIVRYGQNQWYRDENGKRVSRPADREHLIECDVPELQIIPDALWNRVHTRLEETRKLYARDGAQLNDTHRPKYLLAGLLTCGCCGGPFSMVDRRYGCFNRKSRGATMCENSRKIGRPELEAEVLSVLRAPLDDTELATAFAQEAQRTFSDYAVQAGGERAALERKLKDAETAIARLVGLLEDGGSTALVERLHEREAEREQVRLALEALPAGDRAIPLPSPAELASAYRKQIGRLGELLSAGAGGTRIEANQLLKGIIRQVVLTPDGNGGLAIDIQLA